MHYLKHRRYQHARDLMRNGSHSVKSAALQSGFRELFQSPTALNTLSLKRENPLSRAGFFILSAHRER